MTSVSHEEALEILSEAGDEVTLTVKHYKSAAPFLLKNVRQLIPEQQADQDGRRSSAASQRTIESPGGSVTSSGDLSWNGIPRVKRKWVDVIEVRWKWKKHFAINFKMPIFYRFHYSWPTSPDTYLAQTNFVQMPLM